MLLTSAKQQCESATSTNMSPPSWASSLTLFIPPLEVVTEHWVEPLCPYSIFPLAIYFIHALSVLLFQFAPPSPSHTVSKVCSLCLHLYSCSTDRFIDITFSRFHTYALILETHFSLSDLLHFVRQALGLSISLELIPVHSFLWLRNIALYICITTSLPIHLLMDI